MRLLILADTHLPERARDLPAEVWRAVEVADVVLHAGDWVDIALLDERPTACSTTSCCIGSSRIRRASRADRRDTCATRRRLSLVTPGSR